LVLLAPAAIAGVFAACSPSHSSSNDTSDDAGNEGGGGTVDARPKTDSATKPPPKATDAGARDAAPPPPPKNKPDGGRDGGKLTDASVDATPPDSGSTSGATPLDSIDESIMPDEGLAVGTCKDIGLSKDTGFCRNDSSGQDFVEGCVDPTVYLLDCARYDTPGTTRAVCQDDFTTVGCYLHDVSPVGDFEKNDSTDAIDLAHACPSSWEGTGFCDGDFLYMCSGGKDYVLDCAVFNFDSFTYTCGKDANTGTIQCQ
jgi:hypothetical protein